MNKTTLNALSWIGIGLGSLGAESNGFYTDIGFEFSRVQTIERSNTPASLASLDSNTKTSILYSLFKPGASKESIAAAAHQIGIVEGLVKNSGCASKGCLVSNAQMQNFLDATTDAASMSLAISALLAVLKDVGATYNGAAISSENIGNVLYDYMSRNGVTDGTLHSIRIPFSSIIDVPRRLTPREIRPIRSSLYWLFSPIGRANASSLMNNFAGHLYEQDSFANPTVFKAMLASAARIQQAQTALNGVLKSDLNNMKTSEPQKLRELLSYYQELDISPATPTLGILKQFINMGSNDGNMYGVNVQFGFKHFFGAKRRFGLRYYEYFSYQHGNNHLNGALNNFIYGVGIDMLWNFFESANETFTTGFFTGLIFAGSSWLVQGSNNWQVLADNVEDLGGSAHLRKTFFQLPINVGLRTNIGKEGFEIGMRFPVINNTYFRGTIGGFSETLTYKTQMSVFFNWVHNF
ncbi:outer membrane protein [Helicobacter salomonis]|uniref:OMP588 n=1 Tax=Helicobacter salomonis TaxID=56878 RepID=A0A1M4NIV4_9HELI|nr:outer membrane protein [Helicobacter salomonis]SFZ73063.1 OMP588 [Helicobacter salomonis]